MCLHHSDTLLTTPQGSPDVDEVPEDTNDIDKAPDDTNNELKLLRANHPKQIIVGALNINSVRNKFSCIVTFLTLLDCFSIIESKLDESFPDSQFYIKGFNLYRQDSSATSGGIMTFVNSDIANCRRYDIEMNNDHIQSICIECHVRKEKWFIISLYRLPSSNLSGFIDDVSTMLDRVVSESNMIVINGDINVNLLANDSSSNHVNDLLSMYSLTNVIKTATCFKGIIPTLLDVTFVSNPNRISACVNYNCGLSDYHNLVAVSTKMQLPRIKPKVLFYRSMKHFDENSYKKDIENVPFHVINTFDDLDDKLWAFNKLVTNVIEEHAPLKKKYIKRNNSAHMNSKLKKLMYQKRMAQNDHRKNRGDKTKWEKYRKLRNEFVKVNRESRAQYFKDKCGNGPGSRSFWKTVKPYIANDKAQDSDIMLREGDEIVSDSNSIAHIFNDFFSTTTKNIGVNENLCDLEIQEILDLYKDHESVNTIVSKNVLTNNFNFYHVNVNEVSKLLGNIDKNKSTGYDNIPPKLLKVASNELAPAICSLINFSLDKRHFPNDLKYAEISPIFKNGNKLDKSKYRPVSILSCISKIFEKTIDTQFSDHFYSNIAGNLSAYRKGHSTQSVLIKYVEDLKKALDDGKYVGSLLMDLSKAFDVIPHGLLMAKLNAYGYNDSVISLMFSYITERKQRVKIYDARSSWNVINKGVPQGSILGPTLFNVFINDVFYTMKDKLLYNYADDNTVTCISPSANQLKVDIELCGNVMTDWFKCNYMKANPDKYQAIIFGNKADNPSTLTIRGIDVSCQENVKLLGIYIDSTLSFQKQLRVVCKKASNQINAVMRLCNVLETNVKQDIYRSFIKSNFNYCPIIWIVSNIKNLKKLEKIQYRALKFVFNDFQNSYEDLLVKSKNLSVSVYIMHCIVTEVFKCLNELAPVYLQDMFVRHQTRYVTRNEDKLLQRRFKTEKYGYYSFSYLGAKLWNRMPPHIKNAVNLYDFKNQLKSWDDCSCLYKVDTTQIV